MTRAQAVAEHLPYLRRYARALCGTQASGDAYVRACLEAIVADPDVLPQDLSPRIGLYRVFHAIWRTADIDAAPPAETLTRFELRVERRLSRMAETARQVLLLTAMESFTVEEAASILALPVQQVRDALATATADVTRQPSTRVLIIEDEPIIALDLEHILRDMGHTVTAVAITRDEAVAAAQMNEPGLVLADIKLADGSSGIDAVRRILKDVSAPVVFITAYPERLLTGERPEPTFLVTKPFSPEAVRAAVSQALLFT